MHAHIGPSATPLTHTHIPHTHTHTTPTNAYHHRTLRYRKIIGIFDGCDADQLDYIVSAPQIKLPLLLSKVKDHDIMAWRPRDISKPRTAILRKLCIVRHCLASSRTNTNPHTLLRVTLAHAASGDIPLPACFCFFVLHSPRTVTRYNVTPPRPLACLISTSLDCPHALSEAAYVSHPHVLVPNCILSPASPIHHPCSPRFLVLACFCLYRLYRLYRLCHLFPPSFACASPVYAPLIVY